jgi:hypothetical protein
MSIDSAARQHFEGLFAQRKLLEIEVPEWQTSIYFRPKKYLNGAEYAAIYQAAEDPDAVARMFKLLVLRVRQADGTKEWAPTEWQDLMKKLSPAVVADIIRDMGRLDKEVELEAEKKD